MIVGVRVMDETNEIEEITEPGNVEPVDPVESVDEFDDEFEDDDDLDLSVVEKVIGVYVSPVRTFKALAVRPDFWSALIIISLVAIAAAMLILPKTLPLVESMVAEQLQSSPGMTDDQIPVALNAIRIMQYVQSTIGVVIGLAVAWLLGTLLIFFISLIQGLDTDFKRLLGMVPWISFVSILSQFTGVYVIMTRTLESVEQMQDMRLMRPLSLLKVIPDSVDLPVWQDVILGSIDPFFIWALFITVIALEYDNRCTRTQAIVTTAISAIISLAIGAALAMLGTVMQVGAS
jgi:hypothetical protein